MATKALPVEVDDVDAFVDVGAIASSAIAGDRRGRKLLNVADYRTILEREELQQYEVASKVPSMVPSVIANG